NYAGEHILDSITRAGGPKGPGHETWVMLQREGRRATAPFGALVYEPSNNIWTHPGDTIYLYREPQTFVAFGALSATTISGGVQGVVNVGEWRISLTEALGKASGLSDALAEPSAVFLYRGEIREVAERLGIDCSRFPGPIIPVIYNLNLRNPDGFMLATKFQMRNKDVIYVANATTVEITKALVYIRLIVGTVNDPIVAATNAYNLNIVQRTNNRFPVGAASPSGGQGADLLEKRGWDGLPDRVTLPSYSASRSFRTAAIWRSSNSVKRRPRQRSAARMSAPNISLRTGFSPKPFGIIFSRRRSSTKRRSSRFVVRVARRCVTGNRRCAMQASKSSSKQETADGSVAA